MNELGHRCQASPVQVETSFACLREEFQEFKTEMLSVLELLRNQISVLCKSIDDIEMRHRRKYLLVGGIPEDNNIDLTDTVVSSLINKIGLALSVEKLSVCVHLANIVEGQCGPVMLRFTEPSLRATVWSMKTALKGTSHTISEFLTR
ncbi:unnamed protein product [Diatraea saccharalis]|uniref:Uncharacterized protein n=1 Tax=Diatraea saccharalis TaxID=40085 RepID=A0A9N9WG08_9NEOP|nr:unnamed protein product [Diatraea saccharalis]